MRLITLENINQKVKIEGGELVSYQNNGYEYIHQKGSPGWSQADTEMFPIIGPVTEANHMVQVSKGSAVQDQHGHLRLLDYENKFVSNNQAHFIKSYKAGTPVKNKKFPENSNKAMLAWPYDFQFEKKFELLSDRLEITFTITGERDMPFMIGYHPAFKLYSSHPEIIAGNKKISLSQVLEVGSRALEIADCNKVVLKDEKSIEITTQGFKHFMCWTEVSNMICIEPITFYPYGVAQKQLHKGFQLLDSPKEFKTTLTPLG